MLLYDIKNHEGNFLSAENQLLSLVRAMPKIDLHRHLEGSVRLETLIDIAREYDIMLPHYNVDSLRPHVQIMPGDPRSWEHFLAKFLVLRQFYRSPEVVQRVTREVIADAAADNVKYLELRFTPQALNNLMGCSFDTVVAWVCEAATESMTEHDIEVSLIVSMNRHESVEIAEQVLAAAMEHQADGVTGIDLAGQEALFSSRPFHSIFERAKAAGFGITVHAGEWAGAQSIHDAVDYLGADRIGHGIRAFEEDDLLDRLATSGVVFEVCPTSNVQSGVVESLADHPLPMLLQRHCAATINTDDPLISNITLSDEITRVLSYTSLEMDDIKLLTLTAARAAFLPDARREALVQRFETWLASDEQPQEL
jgi:adenosine deaminase